MWFITGLKIAAGLTALGGTASLGLFIYDPTVMGVYHDLNIFGITQEITTTASAPGAQIQEPKVEDLNKSENYKCRITGISDKLVSCKISWFDLDTTNHVTDLSEITKAPNTSIVDKASLKTKDKTIKVTLQIAQTSWDKLKAKIEVVSASSNNELLSSITPLFAETHNIKIGETQYFLGAATAPPVKASAATPSTPKKCSLDYAPDTKSDCELYQLKSSSNPTKTTSLPDLSADDNITTKATTATGDNYYLIKITSSLFKFDLSRTGDFKIVLFDSAGTKQEAVFDAPIPALLPTITTSKTELIVLK